MNEDDIEDDALKIAENGVEDVEMDLQQSEMKWDIIYNEDLKWWQFQHGNVFH
jgi:hypothetical protein